MGGEVFTFCGIEVEEYNFLEIYYFEKWFEKFIPQFKEGDKFRPTYIDIIKN